MDEWIRDSEAVFLNELMTKLLKSLQEYIDQHYKSTILPLADRLAEIDIEMMKKKSDPTIQKEIETIYLPQYTERMRQGMDERLCLEPDELQEILKRREGISDFE